MEIDFKAIVGKRLYPIGFKFGLKRGAGSMHSHTITDYEATFNRQGDLVRFEYVCEYEFMKQLSTARHVQFTIDRASENGWKNNDTQHRSKYLDLVSALESVQEDTGTKRTKMVATRILDFSTFEQMTRYCDDIINGVQFATRDWQQAVESLYNEEVKPLINQAAE